MIQTPLNPFLTRIYELQIHMSISEVSPTPNDTIETPNAYNSHTTITLFHCLIYHFSDIKVIKQHITTTHCNYTDKFTSV